MIRTQGLTRHFTRHKKTVEAVRGLDLEVGARRARRVPRPERRRQVDDAADAHHADRADLRHRPGRRLRRGARARARSGAASGTSARATAPATPSAAATSWSARAAPTGCRRAARARRADELLDALRPDRARRPAGVDALRRPAPPARRRDRPRAHAAAALPRRAVDRPRPAEPGQPAGADPAAARPSTAPRSCSPRTTSRRPTRSPTGWSSSTTAGSSPTTPRARLKSGLGDLVTLGFAVEPARGRGRRPRRGPGRGAASSRDGDRRARSGSPAAAATSRPGCVTDLAAAGCAASRRIEVVGADPRRRLPRADRPQPARDRPSDTDSNTDTEGAAA